MLKRYSNDKLCCLNYEKLKSGDVIDELRPCLEFIGIEIDKDKEFCIRKEQEGNYHRPSMNPEELDLIFNQSFTQEELTKFKNIHEDILKRFEVT